MRRPCFLRSRDRTSSSNGPKRRHGSGEDVIAARKARHRSTRTDAPAPQVVAAHEVTSLERIQIHSSRRPWRRWRAHSTVRNMRGSSGGIMRSRLAATIVAAALLCPACGFSSTSADPVVPAGTYQSAIVAVSGPGTGGVSVTPKAIPEATFAADISVLITGARPNASYIVQRAPEIGRTQASDGVCQRALGVAPWSAANPPAPAFVTFPLGAGVAIVPSAANGTGSLNFE